MGLAKPFPAKCKPFCAICKPSYLGFSEEICKTFQEPALSHHAHYAPHNPDSNLWGHHFGRVQVRSWFARFGRFARRLPPDVVAKGYDQRYGDTYYEKYAPTSSPEGIRLIMALACQRNWAVYQFEFSTAYPHAPLKEKIYMYPPEGVKDPEGLGRIWLLLKSLYGLTQSARNWNHHLACLLGLLCLTSGNCIARIET